MFHSKNAVSNHEFETNGAAFDNKRSNLVLLSEPNNEEDTGKTNIIQTGFNFIKLYIGIAILVIPKWFYEQGIIGGTLGILAVLVTYSRTIVIQSEAAFKLGTDIRSLSELCLKVLGPISYIWINSAIIFVQSGAHVGYLMFNGAQIDQIVWQATQNSICEHSKTYIGIEVLLMIPLWWIKNLRNLSHVSFVVLIGTFVTIWTIIYYSIQKISEDILFQVTKNVH